MKHKTIKKISLWTLWIFFLGGFVAQYWVAVQLLEREWLFHTCFIAMIVSTIVTQISAAMKRERKRKSKAALREAATPEKQ